MVFQCMERWNIQMVIIYTFMVADLFHANHLRFLELAKTYGDKLVVGIISDEAVESYKRKPIYSLDDRITTVAGLRCVDEVVVQYSKSPLLNIIKLNPNIVIHADNWKDNFPDEDKIRSRGIDIIFTPYFKGMTTTDAIRKCQSMEI